MCLKVGRVPKMNTCYILFMPNKHTVVARCYFFKLKENDFCLRKNCTFSEIVTEGETFYRKLYIFFCIVPQKKKTNLDN